MAKLRMVVRRPGKAVADRRKARVRVLGRPATAGAYSGVAVRLAAYRSGSEAPRISDIPVQPLESFVERASRAAWEAVREVGGRIPLDALREVVANLIHADFRDASIVVSPGGNEVTVTDRGPGIADKEKAFLPGYTTASAALRAHIRGVGAGLALARETMAAEGGSVILDDNLGGGTVVRLRASGAVALTRPEAEAGVLSEREKKALLLLGEEGSGGPSLVAQQLEVSLSTAHRILQRLERLGLVVCAPKGKRELSAYAYANFERLVRSAG